MIQHNINATVGSDIEIIITDNSTKIKFPYGLPYEKYHNIMQESLYLLKRAYYKASPQNMYRFRKILIDTDFK